jgi:ssDNA-binding Zn-finger/Zn-ribbon topoisomerase 1
LTQPIGINSHYQLGAPRPSGQKHKQRFIEKNAMDKCILTIPAAMLEYAVRHGARRDPKTKEWYITGIPPTELLPFIQKTKRKPQETYGPACPKCGSYTIQRFRKYDGDTFWGCSTFPRCTGIVEYTAQPTKHALEYLKRPKKPSTKPEKKTPSASLQTLWEEIYKKLVQNLGNQQAAEKWLTQKKVSLEYNTPISLMTTEDGCNKVISLIDLIFQAPQKT